MSQAQLISFASPSVSLHAGRPATTSREVAKFFNKRHDNIVRDIRGLIVNTPESFYALNFEEVDYLDEKGGNRVMFILYRDGFMLLVMGYTGKKAMKMKIAYIEAFNAMEAALAAQSTPDTLPPASVTLTPSTAADRAPLRSIINAWARVSGQPHDALWPQVRAAFNLSRIDQLPAEWIPDAIAWVQEKIDSNAKALPPAKLVPSSPEALLDQFDRISNKFLLTTFDIRNELTASLSPAYSPHARQPEQVPLQSAASYSVGAMVTAMGQNIEALRHAFRVVAESARR